jgi:hypothetical protein
MCSQVLLSIFAVHIESLLSKYLAEPNLFFGPKGVQFGEVTLYSQDHVSAPIHMHKKKYAQWNSHWRRKCTTIEDAYAKRRHHFWLTPCLL